MQHLSTFQFQTSNIRTLIHDDHIYFVAVDIASTLGYSNPRDAIIRHCKKAKSLKDIGVVNPDSFTNQALDPQTVLILEPDMYRLISRSNLESAEQFQDWVFEEVLPSIRKTGSYSLESQTPEPLQLPAPNYATVDAIARKFKITRPLLNFILAQANIGTIKGPFHGKEHYTAHTRELIPWQGNHILWNVDMLKPLIEAEKAPQCVKIPRLESLEKYHVYQDRISNKEIAKALDITRDRLAYYFVKLKLCVSDSFKRTPLGDSMYELGVGWVHSKLIKFLNEHQPRQLTVI